MANEKLAPILLFHRIYCSSLVQIYSWSVLLSGLEISMRITNDISVASQILRQDCLHDLSRPQMAILTPAALLPSLKLGTASPKVNGWYSSIFLLPHPPTTFTLTLGPLGGGLKALTTCEQGGRPLWETAPMLALTPGILHPCAPRLAWGELQHHGGP